MSPLNYTPKSNKKNKSANHEVLGVVLIIIAIFFLLCLIINPIFGVVSQAIFNVMLGVFGLSAYPFFLCLLITGIAFLRHMQVTLPIKNIVCIVILTVFGMLILQLASSHAFLSQDFVAYSKSVYAAKVTVGGVVWGLFAYGIQLAITEIASYIIYSLVIIVTVLYMTGVINKILHKNSKVTYSEKRVPIKPEVSSASVVTPAQPKARNPIFVGQIQAVRKPAVESSNNIQPVTLTAISDYSAKPVFSDVDDEEVRRRQEIARRRLYENSTTTIGYIPDLEDLDMPTNKPKEEEIVKKPDPKVFLHDSESKIDEVYIPQPIGDEVNVLSDSSIVDCDLLHAKYEEEINKRAQLENLTAAAPVESPSEITFDKREITPAPLIVLTDDEPEEEITPEPQAKPKEDYQPNNDSLDLPPYLPDANDVGIIVVDADEPIDADLFDDEEPAPPEPVKYRDQHKRADSKVVRFDDYRNVQEKQEKAVTPNMSDIVNLDDNPEPTKDLYAPVDVHTQGELEGGESVDDGVRLVISDEPAIDSSETTEIYDKETDNTGMYVDTTEVASNAKPKSMRERKPRVPEGQLSIDSFIKDAEEASAEVARPRRPKYVYSAPPISLLQDYSTSFLGTEENSDSVSDKITNLENSLELLKVPAKVTNVVRGPSITRYELEMPSGISVKKIEGLSSDIAYSLASEYPVRIESPIPGKRAVGIEVPNEKVDYVGLRDILQCKDFVDSKSPIEMALGKNVTGKPITANLERMPHLLIAGSTGSGKSACLNSLIVSFMYKSSPDDVRIILVDPKRVEFSKYNHMPHLLLGEIIYDADQTISALKWAKSEMERRYMLFSKYSVSSITMFNSSEVVSNGTEDRIPRIVVIVDELADLMMSAKKRDLEDLIISLSQKARAAGIHLIFATQRPSVDVITGTIKSNLNSRIAFRVNSQGDSRIILDANGAENLVGRGDMLFADSQAPNNVRIQGSYVSDSEVNMVVDYVKRNNPSYFDESIRKAIFEVPEEVVATDMQNGQFDDDEPDALLQPILKTIIRSHQVSTTMMQSRFKIGYVRAARLMAYLEEKNLVGPLENGKREIYANAETYEEMFGESLDEEI